MATIEEMLANINAQQSQTAQTTLSIQDMLSGIQAGSSASSQPEKQSIMDWFKGGKRESNIPLIENANLGLPPEKNAQMLALLTTTASDDRLASGIKKILPDAQFDKDQYDNLVVIAPVFRDGQQTQQYTRFYPNPKGLNTVDIMQAAGAVTAGQALAATGGLIGVPVSGVLGGGLLGLTEAGLIEAASSALSDDPFQVFDLPLGFVGGAAGSKVAQVLGDLIAKIKTSPKAVLDTDGNLKPAVRNQISALGLDPDNITAEIASKLQSQIRKVGDPQASARLTEAQSLPTPVPLTRGDATGSRSQQLFEEQIESGVYGEPARLTMEARRGQQQGAMRQNLEQIQKSLGGSEITQQGQAASQIPSALSALRQSERQAASALFTEADQAGYAFIPANQAGALADSLRASLRTFSPSEVQATSAIVDTMEENLAAAGDIKSLFNSRQRLVKTGAPNTPERAAANAVKSVLDKQLKLLVDQQLLTGNPEAVTAQLKAISNYADFASKWKGDGVLNKLTEKTVRDGERIFKQDPASVANFLFGAKGAKLVSAPEMARDLATLKRTLPEDQWNELRQEAFLHMANRAEGTARSGDLEISGAKFQTFWNEMKNRNPDLVKGLFTPEEQKLISRFASVASRVTSRAQNYSNSATTANTLLQQLSQSIGGTTVAKLALRAPFIRMITNTVASVRAEDAFKVPLGRATQPLSGAAGAGAASGSGGDPAYDLYENISGVRIPR